MSLYCLKCRVWAYRNHNDACPLKGVIPLKRGMHGIVNRLTDIGLCVSSGNWATFPIEDSHYSHSIVININFRHQFQPAILGDLPVGWKWYTETTSEDHTPLMVVIYSETFTWSGSQTVEERVIQIIREFETYLDTLDKDAIAAIMTFMYS